MKRREDAHREALRAAARLAFSAAVLGGCSPATPTPTPAPTQVATIGNPPPSPPASMEPPPNATPEPSASQAPLDAAACDALVARTFPGVPTRVDPKTAPSGLVACCEDRALERYDPNCCSFLFSSGTISWKTPNGADRDIDDREHRILRSCSPWGPPMPPSARARARTSHRIAERRSRGNSRGRTLSLRKPARRHALTVPDLPSLREAAIATWRARMVNEHGSARVFEGLARQVARAGLDHEEVARFADEERRHGILCGAVVEALG
ncbi:MAG: hypothetical protein ACRELY_13130 [Polyangiaceae bacterium]